MILYLRRRPAKRAGAEVAELAVLLPMLCFLFVVAVDYGRIFYYSLTVTNCARNGALYGSQDASHAVDTAGITTACQQDAANLNLSSMTVTSRTDSSTSPTYVEVTVTYPFTTITNYPAIPSQTTLTRTIRMQVVPYVPSF